MFYKFTLFLISILIISSSVYAQETNLDWRIHNVGKVRQVITNNGALNAADHFAGRYNYPYLINCEFPPNSNEEHIYLSGIWIGAINDKGDTLVSVTRTHFTDDEFFASSAPYDTVWAVQRNDTANIPYLPDYVAVSDQDFVCRYSDYNILNIADHHPLYLDVIQRSYAWSSPPLDEFIVLQYDIIPVKDDIHKIYISYWQQGEVGDNKIGDNWIDEYTLFYPDEQMGVTEDAPAGNDGNAYSPIGIKILEPQDSEKELRWAYQHYTHADLYDIARDQSRYENMSSGKIMQNIMEPMRSHFTISFGPFETVAVGDTLHIELALVFGDGLEGMLDNAEYLEFLTTRDFKVPSPPPTPVLQISSESHKVHLSWYPPDDAHNPEKYKDPYRGDGEKTPFEGYRLYKSTASSDGPWTLLAEFDIDTNKVGFNTGLEYEYDDIGLLDYFDYYYTLTAFSKADSVADFPSLESSLSANCQRLITGTAPPKKVGKVAVVPNPYRGDIAYHQFDPPWEKVPGSREWMEQDRLIKFINLPADCQIKIYTLAGNLVDKVEHCNPTAGYENWNLTSSAGQAVSSGIYLFTVEDLKSGDVQTGKFVIIK
jgi:hypothetical protein